MNYLTFWISCYEGRPDEPYPDSTSAITVGLCVGQLSAIAVSQARSLIELIPLAVESVRVAFRTGLAAIRVRDELEQQSSPQESWAMTVSREVGLTENSLLEAIHGEMVRNAGLANCKMRYMLRKFAANIRAQKGLRQRIFQESTDSPGPAIHAGRYRWLAER
jgi:Starter unit:ACP transacylase in aflatoxin biosynthesis